MTSSSSLSSSSSLKDEEERTRKSEGIITLNDLIGDTSHLICTCNTFSIRGLTVKTWLYTHPDYPWSGGDTSLKYPPVIGIHGGPAFTHGYILPLKLLANYGYPVILYDQCGCGESSRVESPTINSPWLFTLEYYLEELEMLIKQYSLTKYYIYGSSWGTMLGQEFAVKQPSGLLGIMLDGALADANLYIKTQWRDRIHTLPTFSYNLLKKMTDEKDFKNPLYSHFNDVLSRHFSCRLVPWPDFFTDCFKTMNDEIYKKMQGESEFTIGGVLENWSIVDRLHFINVPTLVMIGEYDTMTPECAQIIVDKVNTAWPLIIIPRAGHCKLVDEPLLCVEHFAKFLNTCETIRKSL